MSWTEVVLLGHFAVNVLLALRVIYSRRSTEAALGWLVVLFALPYVGTLCYLLIGEPRLGNDRARRKADLKRFYEAFRERFVRPCVAANAGVDPRFARIARLVEQDVGFTPDNRNAVRLITQTDAIVQAFVADIDRAEVSCLVMFYIIDGAGRVGAVLDALMRAAGRGVNCRVLADAVGSRAFLESAWVARLRDAGVEVTAALPVGFFKTLFVRSDLRNHRKLLVVDYRVAYVGSYNLVDPETFKQDSGVGQWVDAVMRLDGAAARVLSAVYYADWAVENDHNFKSTIERIEGYFANGAVQAYVPEDTDGGAVLQVIPSGPDSERHVVYDTLLCALYAAQSEVVITTPYFVPDEALLAAILNAARRGAQVVLMLPERNDSRLVGYASKAYYQMLLDGGVQIALFGGGLLHTKTVMVDGEFALFGTVNMDMRSFYLNMELSLSVYDRETVAHIARLQKQYLMQSKFLSSTRWQKRPRLQHFVESCVRLVSPLL